MSQTIYARVPDDIKEAADIYASERGMTLANAIADLLDRGLQAVADEGSIADLEVQVTHLRAANDLLTQRDHAASSAYQALAQRTAQPVGACPNCGNSITGYDLLVSGRCAQGNCGASLTPLLGGPSGATAAKGRLDDGEFKVLLGALGLLLGIAYVSQQAGGG